MMTWCSTRPADPGRRQAIPMMGQRFIPLLSLLFLALPDGAWAEELIAEFKGSFSRTTAEFEVEAPWILDWRVSTDGDHDAAVSVSLERAGTGYHEGRVLEAKYPGNGVRMFDQSGEFQFQVDSMLANWTLRVVQLTKEEAKLYTPRDRSLLD